MTLTTGALFPCDPFEPTPAAAQARLAAVQPAAYARSRNQLDGAVTRLSPYLTHGFLSVRDVLAALHRRGPLPVQHKLVFELAWREYFHHVWHHLGDGIFESLHEGVLPDNAYARELPADIRQARTGVPVIDEAVRTLYATGYLHNHVRMWLASYVVHLRKVHWRTGADWLYGHLLDGDLASNHLSWQWVAGTGSHKPYLFNAENVARYAPPAWHSTGSVVDRSYEELDLIARQTRPLAALPAGPGVEEPALLTAPPPGLFIAPDAQTVQSVQGRTLRCVHPWSLAATDSGSPANGLTLGIASTPFHARWPWSPARWHFVGTRMQAMCDVMWAGPPEALRAAWTGAAAVHGVQDRHGPGPASDAAPNPREHWLDSPRCFEWPAQRCRSFSQFWTRVSRGVSHLDAWIERH